MEQVYYVNYEENNPHLYFQDQLIGPIAFPKEYMEALLTMMNAAYQMGKVDGVQGMLKEWAS